MPINYDNFIFHSWRVPFGSIVTKDVEIPLGGSVTMSGKTVYSETIPVEAQSIAPKIIFTIPSGTWETMLGDQPLATGTRMMTDGFAYRPSAYPNLREVRIIPFIRYVTGGIQVGVRLDMGFAGTNPGSVTVPSQNLKVKVIIDVVPQNTK